MWLPRDLGQVIRRPSLPVRVLVGPRQTGKSALLAREFPDAVWMSLDDLQVRQRAQQGPSLFLDTSGLSPDRPLILDEGAYAPNLFPELKRRVDEARRSGAVEPQVWITGSNQQLLTQQVRETLAGRASYFSLHTCSVHELGERATVGDWFLRGGYPELYARPDLDPSRYLADYVRTFVEKDVALVAGVRQTERFLRALQLLAARTGTLLNATDIGQLAGIKGQTFTAWLDVLQQNALAYRLQPYHSNLTKRLVRTPKAYLLDVGLAAHLQGWRSVDPLLVSPQAGPLFETLVMAELIRARDHLGLPLTFFFWRTKEGEEIDFLVELHGPGRSTWVALEAKFANQAVDDVPVPPMMSKEFPDLKEVWVVTPGGVEAQLAPHARQVPIRHLTRMLSQLALR